MILLCDVAVVTIVLLVLFVLLCSDAPRRGAGNGGWLELSAEEARLFEDAGMLEGVGQEVDLSAPARLGSDVTPVKSVVTWDSLQKGSAATAPPPAAHAALQGGRPSAVRELFASPATWVLFLAHATYNFVRYTIEQEMPKFFNDVSKNEEFWIENEDFCVKTEGLCIKNEELCI